MRTVNNYKCQGCGMVLVTKLLEQGTTPFILVCTHCNSDMHSSFFQCDQNAKPDLLWFKPTDHQLKKQVDWELRNFGLKHGFGFEAALNAQKEHVERGGLVLGPDQITIDNWNQ